MRDFFIESGDVRLAVRDYGGEGRSLLFVHGGPGPNLGLWEDFPQRFAGRFRAIAYDQRGHGQSDDTTDYSYATLAGDIQAIIDALRLDGTIVVGHSWGGMIALSYAAAYPDCAGVVVVDGPVTGEQIRGEFSDEAWAWMEEQLRENPVLRRMHDFAGTADEAEEFIAWARTAAPVHYPEFSEQVFRRNLVAGPDGLLRNRSTPEQFMARARAGDEQEPPPVEIYGRIRCPVLLVMATDGLFSQQVVERMRGQYPTLRVEWLECGHDVPRERPDELADLITGFASQQESN
jgi:pimeloyl-ACP methyl ester carboxylesterase